jgi:hypothetical protein
MPKIVYNGKKIATATDSYNDLTNKPMINSVQLLGNITFSDLGLFPVGYIYTNTTGLKPTVLGGAWELLGTEEKFGKTFYTFERVS